MQPHAHLATNSSTAIAGSLTGPQVASSKQLNSAGESNRSQLPHANDQPAALGLQSPADTIAPSPYLRFTSTPIGMNGHQSSSNAISSNTALGSAIINRVQADQAVAGCQQRKSVHRRREWVRARLAGCIGCRMGCSSKFTPSELDKVNSDYWSGTFADKRRFMDKSLVLSQPNESNRRNRPKKGNKERQRCVNYYLRNSAGQRVRVCKSMFLRTLGLKSDGRITSYLHNLTNPLKDNRGSFTKHPQANYGAVIRHINSFHPQVSHYTQLHAAWRRYMDPALSIRKLYKDYLSNPSNGPLKYPTYYKIFRKQRITFGCPKVDLCEICETHKFHIKIHNADPIQIGSCESCSGHTYHLNMAAASRRHYLDDSHTTHPPHNVVYSVGMQRILLLPILKQKSCFFTSRLVTFNETFASMSGHPDLCVMWNEEIAGRLAPDVTSAFAEIIMNRFPVLKNLTFWMDNCSAQNKNWCLYLAMLSLVNHPASPDSITLKYLERGHTYMRADSIHGAIGRKIRRVDSVCTFDDLLELIGDCGKNIRTVPLEIGKFRDWTSLRKQAKNLPRISKMRCVQFRKNSPSIYYKLSLDYPNFSFISLSQNVPVELPPPRFAKRGINSAKKDRIVESLVPLMPFEKRAYWQDLQISHEADLCTNIQ